MTPTREQTEQALGWVEGFEDDDTLPFKRIRDGLEPLIEAARAWLRLAPVTCPTCDGSGKSLAIIGLKCWKCAGSGVVPPTDLTLEPIRKLAEEWSNAYPIETFPRPDLTNHDPTLCSAAMGRHMAEVLSSVLAAIEEADDE